MKNYKVLLLTTATLVAIAWGICWPFKVSGDCMEPAVRDGQVRLLNRMAPHVRGHKMNDIILFTYEGKVWISRIVALSASTIQIHDGGVVVDGDTNTSVGIHRNWNNWKYGTYAVDKSFVVPPDHVFVLSDNLSAHHDDSRVFGPVPKKSIIGLVW